MAARPHLSCSYEELDSNLLPDGGRFHAWRETMRLPMLAEPFDHDGRHRFRIRLRRLASTHGRFAELAATPMKLVRTLGQCRGDGVDVISLLMVSQGDTRMHTGVPDRAVRIGAGQVIVKDFSRPAEAWCIDPVYRGLNVHLPRASVEAALGNRISAVHGAVLSLNQLAPLLKAQLTLAEIAPRLTASARAEALESTVELAISTLRLEFGAAPEDEVNDPGLFAAAQVVIRRNLGSVRLTPELIARQLGCSRAHLYRIFSQHGEAVADYVREQRLQRARALLATPSIAAERISDVAYQCGFSDPVHFARLFRHRFGVRPSDVRAIGGESDAA
jgi:AraC-like DNA-binding protein